MDMRDFVTLRADALLYSLDDESDTSPDDESNEEEQLSLLESLRDPEVSRAVRNREYEGWSPARMISPHRLGLDPSSLFGDDGDESRITQPYPPIDLVDTGRRQAPDARRTPPLLDGDEAIDLDSGARVTVDYNEHISWPEDPSRADVLADRRRRNHLTLRGEDPYVAARQMRSSQLQRRREQVYTQRVEERRRRMGLSPPRREDPTERRCDPTDSVPYLRARHEATRKTVAKDLSHFRFIMQEGKNTASMKFDPPM